MAGTWGISPVEGKGLVFLRTNCRPALTSPWSRTWQQCLSFLCKGLEHRAHPHKEMLMLNNISKVEMISFFLRLIWVFLWLLFREIAAWMQLVKQFRSLPESHLYLPLHQSPFWPIVCTKLVFPFRFPAGNSTCIYLHLTDKEMVAQWHLVTLQGSRDFHLEKDQWEPFYRNTSVSSPLRWALLHEESSFYWWVLLLFSVKRVLSPQDMLQVFLFWGLPWWERFAPRVFVIFFCFSCHNLFHLESIEHWALYILFIYL